MEHYVRRQVFFFTAGWLPPKTAGRASTIFKILDTDRVIAAEQLNRSGLFSGAVEAIVIHHQLVVDPEPRAVI